jgi:pimeloyl-ACP methyl ester carboxylesterase
VRTRRLLRWPLRIVGTLAALYLLALGALYAAQDALIFPGWEGPTEAQVASVPGLAETVVPGDPPLRAWVRPADPGAPTIVVFHGNAGFQWAKLTAFAERGWGIVLAAYRGFAGNPGDPSEDGLTEDARAVLAFAAALGIAPERTVLFGESLGTGVAARMAAEAEGWRGLVLDSPYASLSGRAAEMYPWFPVRALIRHDFDTRAALARVDAPILILHGTADLVIPVSHGRALAALVPEARAVWIEGGTHFLPPDRVASEVATFLEATGD